MYLILLISKWIKPSMRLNTKEQITVAYKAFKHSLGDIPILVRFL